MIWNNGGHCHRDLVMESCILLAMPYEVCYTIYKKYLYF